jgi:hypothetical protein
MVNKIKTWLKEWWKRNIADDVPEQLNDIF